MELWLPYGRTEIPVGIPDDNFYRIVEPKKPGGSAGVAALVENALTNPVGGVGLDQFVKRGLQAGIIVDPIVPVDARTEAVKAIASKLSTLGVNSVRVFVRKRISSTTNANEEFKPLDPSQNSFTELGKTSLGTNVDLDPELLTCEIRVFIGLAMPHFAMGLTGGPEAVIPACSSLRSIAKNRSLLMKGFPEPLEIDNLVVKDSLEACKLAGPVYNLCFLPDGFGGVTEALAGELENVFRQAASHFIVAHNPRIERKLDIVLVSTGGTQGPDLYHAVRVVANVLGALKKGGTVILVAECSKGIGDPVFLDYARRLSDPKELSAELRHRFKLGAHVYLLLKGVLERCRVQIVSVLPELLVRDTFDLKPSQTATEAVQKAIRLEGKESKILVVPRGEVTVPVMEPIQSPSNI